MKLDKIDFDLSEATLGNQDGGSCVLQAITNAMEIELTRRYKLNINIDANKIFAWALDNDYKYNFDSGEIILKQYQDEFGSLPATYRDTDEDAPVRLLKIRTLVSHNELDIRRLTTRFIDRGFGLIGAYPVYAYSYQDIYKDEGRNYLQFPPFVGEKYENPSIRAYHAVTIAGFYGRWRDPNYYILANSYGETWGNNNNGTMFLKPQYLGTTFSDIRVPYCDMSLFKR